MDRYSRFGINDSIVGMPSEVRCEADFSLLSSLSFPLGGRPQAASLVRGLRPRNAPPNNMPDRPCAAQPPGAYSTVCEQPSPDSWLIPRMDHCAQTTGWAGVLCAKQALQASTSQFRAPEEIPTVRKSGFAHNAEILGLANTWFGSKHCPFHKPVLPGNG